MLLVVDQLRGDYIPRWQGQLSGGLARFWHEGAFYTDGRQDHAVTETAPGHSTLLSGRWPAHTGIVANALGVQDSAAPLIDAQGEGASPKRFRGTTLADWLLLGDSGTRILSISRKDRGAILPIGRLRTQVFWYAGGAFTSSTYYMERLPRWVASFDSAMPARRLAGSVWRPLLPDSAYPEPDAAAWENGGRENVFPHELTSDPDSAAGVLVNFPLMDSLTLAFALRGVHALGLGRRSAPDLLVVSLSTTDAVGHLYGPESRELHDQVIRLDRWLGAFLDSLSTIVPRERTLLALTADHGVMPYPEWTEAVSHRAGGRVDLTDIVTALNSGLGLKGGETFDAEAGLIYGDVSALRRRGIDVDSLAIATARKVAAHPGVTRAYTPAALATAPSADVEALLWRRLIPADFGWLACASVARGWIWSPGPGLAQHGTTQLQDQRVPIAFLGRGIAARHYDRPVSTTDIAPTLAALLGVRPGEPLDGHALRELTSAASLSAR